MNFSPLWSVCAALFYRKEKALYQIYFGLDWIICLSCLHIKTYTFPVNLLAC